MTGNADKFVFLPYRLLLIFDVGKSTHPFCDGVAFPDWDSTQQVIPVFLPICPAYPKFHLQGLTRCHSLFPLPHQVGIVRMGQWELILGRRIFQPLLVDEFYFPISPCRKRYLWYRFQYRMQLARTLLQLPLYLLPELDLRTETGLDPVELPVLLI